MAQNAHRFKYINILRGIYHKGFIFLWVLAVFNYHPYRNPQSQGTVNHLFLICKWIIKPLWWDEMRWDVVAWSLLSCTFCFQLLRLPKGEWGMVFIHLRLTVSEEDYAMQPLWYIRIDVPRVCAPCALKVRWEAGRSGLKESWQACWKLLTFGQLRNFIDRNAPKAILELKRP